MIKRLLLFCILVFIAIPHLPASAQDAGGVHFQEMQCERLPGMNIPRLTHGLVAIGEDIIAIGGHTKGFVPTSTAEVFRDGKWHLSETVYPHDGAMTLKLRSGNIIIAGGYSGDFGIGQSFGVEMYDASSRSFHHLPIMDSKRTHCTGLELENGEILITGNWYAPDNMELYRPDSGGSFVKEVSQQRNTPWVLSSGPDNAIAFSSLDSHGDTLRPIIVDRLYGDPFIPDLLKQWSPVHVGQNLVASCEYEIGNCSYLIPVIDRSGRYAPMLVAGESFSILPTEYDIPAEGPWGRISWISPFFTDKAKETAWLPGTDADNRIYLLKIAYGPAIRGGKATQLVYYTKPQPGLVTVPPGVDAESCFQATPRFELLPGGRFIVAGGAGGYSLYDPSTMVCLLYPGIAKRNKALLWWALSAVALALAATFCVLMLRRSGRRPVREETSTKAEDDLRSRLTDLLEKRQYFRNKDASLASVAAELGTNQTYISAVVNGTTGQSFPQLINGYRIAFAQKLMKEKPDMPVNQVADESGFPNESTFLRNFKARTGLTPGQWKAQLKNN